MAIRQLGGVFGRNPEFQDVKIDGELTASSVDINGGAIDGTVIGGSAPAAISGTTGAFSGNLTVDTNTLFVDAANKRVSINGTPLGFSVFEIVQGVNKRIATSTAAAYGGNALVGSNDAGSEVAFGIAGSSLTFSTNATPRMTIDTAGNVNVVGALSKGSGSFKIDHPVKPDTHHLVHSFIEGPQADNLYRGKVALVNGVATVNLDEAGRMTDGTFVALNGNVQCFTTNECGWTSVRGNVDGNLLRIEAHDAECADEVSWMVIGERQDANIVAANWTDENGRVIVEPEKVAAPDDEISDPDPSFTEEELIMIEQAKNK
jgi:hypothetical protein